MAYERGEKRWNAKLTEAKVRSIIERTRAGERLRDIAPDFPEVSKVSIHLVMTGKKWRHVWSEDRGAIADPASTERAAIVNWLREAGNHDFDQFGVCRRCDAADAIERGEHIAADTLDAHAPPMA